MVYQWWCWENEEEKKTGGEGIEWRRQEGRG